MNIRTKDGKRIVRLTQAERRALRYFVALLMDLRLVEDDLEHFESTVRELVAKYDKDEVVL